MLYNNFIIKNIIKYNIIVSDNGVARQNYYNYVFDHKNDKN